MAFHFGEAIQAPDSILVVVEKNNLHSISPRVL
jgi:hypothetical protein